MQDFEVLDQRDSERTIDLKNGNKLNVKRSDPYGFWTIHYERGQVPRELTGQYTSADRALEAVSIYLEVTNKEPATEAGNNKKK